MPMNGASQAKLNRFPSADNKIISKNETSTHNCFPEHDLSPLPKALCLKTFAASNYKNF